MMKKVHTEYRSQLKNDTICAILATKINTDTECYNCETNKELLAAAKQATLLGSMYKSTDNKECVKGSALL